MTPSRAAGLLSLTMLFAVAGTGCRAPMRFVAMTETPSHLPRLAPHRSVQEVRLRVHGRELPLVAHFALHEDGEVRVHIGDDSGLTVMDVGVRDGQVEVHSEGVGSDGTRFASWVAADLVRVFGERSVFAAPEQAHAITEDGRVALALRDGSFAVLTRKSLASGAPRIHVLLLDPERRPEARIVYTMVVEDGLPAAVSLTDLRDGHRLDIDVLDVLPPREQGP